MISLWKTSLGYYKPLKCCVKHFRTTSIVREFWEPDEKGGYHKEENVPSKTQLIRDGLKELKHEIRLWSREVKEHFESDPYLIFRPGETDVMWKFDNPDALNNWVVTGDKDHNEGNSSCTLVVNKYGKGVFSGELDTKVPIDGRIKRTGYCNIKTVRVRKSFKRNAYIDWSQYNMLVLKVRGDGRSYLLNIHCKGFFDLTWNDTYHFPLYTRGGPHWQITKIPFSQFFFASKGRIQDRQHPVTLQKVTSIGITMADKIKGKFALEIDYIGVEFDPAHTEEFAYEMYKTASNIVAT